MSEAAALARMSARQHRAFERVCDANRETRAAAASYERRRIEEHGAIYEAMEVGVPARVLAERLDVSVERVHAVRSEVAALRR